MGWLSKTGACHSIQFNRGPVSPSVMVRDAADALPQNRRDGPDHLIGVRERNAPHDLNVTPIFFAHWRSPRSPGV